MLNVDHPVHAWSQPQLSVLHWDDDARRSGPRSIVSKTHKYCPSISTLPQQSPIYRHLTLSHSLHEHPEEEQVSAPWDPRHDPISARFSRSISHPRTSQETN